MIADKEIPPILQMWMISNLIMLTPFAPIRRHKGEISIPQALLEFGKKGAIAMEQLRENLIGLENNDQLVTKRPNSEVNGALSLARVQSSKKK